MPIVPMQKVAVLAHRPLREQLLDTLQAASMVQISEQAEPPAIDHTEVNFRRAEVQFAIDTLSAVADKATLAASLKTPTPEQVLAAVQTTDVRSIVDALHRLEHSDTEATALLHEAEQKQNALGDWSHLPYRLDARRESVHTELVFGTLEQEKFYLLQPVLQEQLPRTFLEDCGRNGTLMMLTAHVWKGDFESFEAIATAHGWTTVALPRAEGTAGEIVERAKKEEQELRAVLRKNAEERRRLSRELPAIRRVMTYLYWLDAKQHARESAAETRTLTTILGWMPREKISELERTLQKVSPAIAVLRMKADEGEEPPVLLKNNKLITPFESVTTLYGLPLPHEFDPTPLLAPFFIVYYALCLTDGGYGIAIALLTGALLAKTRQRIEEAPLIWLLFFSGIVSMLVGIPFGGWFGLRPDQVPEFFTTMNAAGDTVFLGQIWNLGTQDGINFLQYLALGLGVTHLFFGMFIAGYYKWVHGNKAAGFWQDFTPHITLAAVFGLLLAPPEWKQIAQYVLYGTVAMLVWGKGYGSAWYVRPLFGLLGVANMGIGLLSNGLSYLRILALGLVTGAIAMAVNQVAVEMSKLFPWFLQIPVMILIAVGGHSVSIALNALGSFIHSGRLQFIEFFGQFFEGGGKPFLPFSRALRA